MKKVFISITAFLLVTLTLSVPVYASYFSFSYTADFSKQYIELIGGGVMTMRYNPGGAFSSVRASTDLSVANEETGTAYVWIKALNTQEVNHYGHKKVNNVINSGKVKNPGQSFAKEAFHSVERTSVGVTHAWACECH